MKFIKTLLLCYLSLAVLLPSYQGFEEGQEFHFFQIMEAGASCHHYDTGGPELRAPYETDHEHSIIYFVPPARIKKDLSQSGPPGQLIYRSDADLSGSSVFLWTADFSARLSSNYIYAHKTSGLSPPPG